MTQVSVVLLTKAQAKALTERIRKGAESLKDLLLEAHEGEAWRALGYLSWGEYIAGEFAITSRNSYYLIQQAKATKFLTELAGEPVQVTVREAQAVKHVSQSEVAKAFHEAEESGLGVQEAAREAIKQAKAPITRSRVADEGFIENETEMEEDFKCPRCGFKWTGIER